MTHHDQAQGAVPKCTCPGEWTPDPACPLGRYLNAKEEAAAELYREGKITRAEAFRHGVEVSIHLTRGPIKLENA